MSDTRHPLWPWLTGSLQPALDQLYGHAALLHGPEGIGQFEFALALSRAWLCEQSAPGTPLKPACGRCASCHLIDAGSHPDLMVILPEALQLQLGWGAAGADEGEQEKSSKTRKPSQEIKVEAIRQVVQFAQHTASRGRAKVVLVYPAERMNMVAANTLLKTLEEPPGQVRFVLSGSALEDLLPTVRSRCQAWRMPMPDERAAVAWLAEQTGMAASEAGVLLAAAGGQPLTARDRQALGLDAKSWPALPKAVQTGDASAFAGWPIALVVESLQKLSHDLCRVSVGAQPRFFPAQALPKLPDLERLTAWAQSLQKVARHADHPWNAGLKIEALLVEARSAMASRPVRASTTK